VDPTQDTTRLIVYPPLQFISMATEEKLINKNLKVYATDSFFALKEKLERLIVSKKELNATAKKALSSQNLLSKPEYVSELKKGLETLYQNGRIKEKVLRKLSETAEKLIEERS
jgi:hypothetical protein